MAWSLFRRQPKSVHYVAPPDVDVIPVCHDILLGWVWEGARRNWLTYGPDKEKSLITVAPSRSGKTSCQLGYELTGYGGRIDGVAPALVVNDSKGELCAISARARSLLGDVVYRLDPFHLVDDGKWCDRARVNVLDGITPASRTFASDIGTLAAALILQEGKDPHWPARARQLVACLLAHMCDDSNPEPAQLPYLLTILGLSPELFRAYMQRLTQSPLRMVRNLAGAFTEESKEVSAIISTALGQLDFLNDDNIADILAGPSSFSWSDLKRGGITVYICLPEAEAKAYSRFTRLLFGSAMKALYRPPKAPVLLILDEIATALGNSSLDIFATSFSLGSGFGIRVHALFQSLPQLNSMFGDQAMALMSSAGVMQFYRPNDAVSARFMSDRAGRRTESILTETNTFTDNGNGQGGSTSTGFSWQHYDRPLITELQLYDLDTSQILFFEGMSSPILAGRTPYMQSDWLHRFDPNPYHK